MKKKGNRKYEKSWKRKKEAGLKKFRLKENWKKKGSKDMFHGKEVERRKNHLGGRTERNGREGRGGG